MRAAVAGTHERARPVACVSASEAESKRDPSRMMVEFLESRRQEIIEGWDDLLPKDQTKDIKAGTPPPREKAQFATIYFESPRITDRPRAICDYIK